MSMQIDKSNHLLRIDGETIAQDDWYVEAYA